MRNSFSFIFGGALVFFGAIFLLDNLGYLDSDWILNNFWPIVLILGGIALIGKWPRRRDNHYADGHTDAPPSSGTAFSATSGDHISESEVFGSIHRQLTSKNFAGGLCSVVFGEIKLDLTQVELLPGEQVLRFNSVFGTIRAELPADLEYSAKINLVAGGLNVKGDRRGGLFQNVAVRSGGFATAEKRLTIIASSVFGDIKIS
jgi:predicted membrane protein